MRVLSMDPGDHTGWMFMEDDQISSGGTVVLDLEQIASTIETLNPDVVIYETFRLYPQAAKHLVNNDFYTCQVIGAIKLTCLRLGIPYVVPQAPKLKEFSGGFDSRWKAYRARKDVAFTEHMKDAYLHVRYYEKVSSKKLQEFKLPASY